MTDTTEIPDESFQILKLHEPSEIEKLTSEGWDFCAAVQVRAEDWTGYGEHGQMITRPMMTTMLVMAQPRTWTVRDLQDNIATLDLRIKDLARLNTIAHEELAAARINHARSVAQFKDNAEDDRSERLRLRESRDAAVTRQRSLESDMAKVRNAIGDIKWNEILAATQ